MLEPPREVTLEFGLEFIVEDELLEVTPDAIRIRKALPQHAREEAGSKGDRGARGRRTDRLSGPGGSGGTRVEPIRFPIGLDTGSGPR